MLLDVNDIWVYYGKSAAVRGVSMCVDEGEMVGMIGPNGAGKSTTLRSIVGLKTPQQGSIILDGQSIKGMPPERILRLGISLVPEGRRILSTLTVEENLKLGATMRKDLDIEADLARLLERFPPLEQFLHRPAGSLSGGEQQQLAIARALLARPRLVLLDEPSLGLAPFLVELVFDLLKELREQGTTLLLVEQNARRIVELADRAYVVVNGRVVLSGDRNLFTRLSEEDLERAYLGEI